MQKILISMLTLVIFFFSITTVDARSLPQYYELEKKVDTAISQLEDRIEDKSIDQQTQVYQNVRNKILILQLTKTKLDATSTYLLNYIDKKCQEAINKLQEETISIDDIFDDIVIEEEYEEILATPYNVQDIITKGDEKLTIGQFKVSGKESDTGIVVYLKSNKYGYSETYHGFSGYLTLKKNGRTIKTQYINEQTTPVIKGIDLSDGIYTLEGNIYGINSKHQIQVYLQYSNSNPSIALNAFSDEEEIITPIPGITPGYIDDDERGESEIGKFTVENSTLKIDELELGIRSDDMIQISKGKVYILDSNLRSIAENTGYRQADSRTRTSVFFRDIELKPGKYTLWVENISINEDIQLEIYIDDLEVSQLGRHGEYEDFFEEEYIGEKISMVHIHKSTKLMLDIERIYQEYPQPDSGVFAIDLGSFSLNQEVMVDEFEISINWEGGYETLDEILGNEFYIYKYEGGSKNILFSGDVTHLDDDVAHIGFFRNFTGFLYPGKYYIGGEFDFSQGEMEVRISDYSFDKATDQNYDGTYLSNIEFD